MKCVPRWTQCTSPTSTPSNSYTAAPGDLVAHVLLVTRKSRGVFPFFIILLTNFTLKTGPVWELGRGRM
jgi:hypothetical protein